MKNIKALTLLFLLNQLLGAAQNSITPKDIEITTQLSFLDVQASSRLLFEKELLKLSSLAKEIELSENLDWLVYETDSRKFLFINFSDGIDDVLTLKDYREQFSKAGSSSEVEDIFEALASCEFEVTENFLQEMLLPWSTVKEISVQEHPLTTMTVFKIYPKHMGEFDKRTRQLVKLLKETEYPYPLEGNRGSLGAYGSVFHIWFYDKDMEHAIYDHLENWMRNKGKLKKYEDIRKSIDQMVISQKDHQLIYRSEMSY